MATSTFLSWSVKFEIWYGVESEANKEGGVNFSCFVREIELYYMDEGTSLTDF